MSGWPGVADVVWHIGLVFGATAVEKLHAETLDSFNGVPGP
jgi:hypothetical protein